MDKTILIADKVSKKYISGTRELTVLDAASFTVDQGEQCAIVGPSGSGKTTLLGLCAGLDQASSGSILLHGVNLNQMNEDQRAAIRNDYVGFVFQQFNLLAGLTAVENVMIPMELKKMKSARSKALELLDAVGLADRAGHYPTQLSGGEQQRVSIARAFANEPAILFADEPTGNLDEETGAQIESLLFEMNRMHGTTLVVVTHDMELARKTGRMLRMKGGKLFDEIRE